MNMWSLCFILCWQSLSSCGQPSNKQPLLGKVYSEFCRAIANEQTAVVFKTFDSFNWTEGAPGPGILNCANCYDVGYNDRNELVEVLYLDHSSPFNGCRMRLYVTNEYRFMTLEKKNGNEYGFLPIFFVIDVKAREAYMINTRPQTGSNPTARALFEGGFPLSSIDSISAIMVLDDMFKPKFNVRFSKGTAFLGSEILYHHHNGMFEKEKIYLMNFDHESNRPTLSDSFNLRNIPTMFESSTDFNFTAIPDIDSKFLSYPLWFWGGAYGYR